MKPVLLLFHALGCLCVLSVRGQRSSYHLKDVEHVVSLAKSKFTCPRAIGVFPDPEDCSWYYVCVGSFGVRRKCKSFLKFDSVKSQCVFAWIAVCFDGKTQSTTSPKSTTPSKKVTKSVTSTTSDDTALVCSSFMGTFAHPDDCSKYYSCMLFIPSVKTCPKKQLFDAVKKACKPEGGVHCGTRKRPTDYTTTEVSAKSTTVVTRKEDKSTKILATTTSKPPDIVSETTFITNVPTDVTTETIVPTVVTTETTVPTKDVQPTGPPDHNCDENDLDCIITETGDVKNWFKCPDDIASYPHPSSDKLFIFCMNWTPSVKKCGVDLVFSKELLTCVNTLYM